MQTATAHNPSPERPLSLDMVVRDLVADGLVAKRKLSWSREEAAAAAGIS